MQITVKLFATFRTGRFDIEARDYPEGTTVAAIVDDLGLPREQLGILMINGRHVDLTRVLAAGETLAIFPLVGGAEMDTLQDYLKANAAGDLLAWQHQAEAAERFGLSLAAVEEAIFAAGLLPARYQRNRQMISTAQQQQLFRSRVAVVGAGGLGGYILEQLARLGVGQIVTIDDDVFEENNLNRQLLSSPADLGRVKVEVAAERIAVDQSGGDRDPGAGPLRPGQRRGAAGRRRLRGRCRRQRHRPPGARRGLRELEMPLVHGAIAGWYGHVATIFPGERSLQTIYRHWQGGKGVEQQLGNPSFTPAWRPVSRPPRSARCCSARGGCCAIASSPSTCSTWRSSRFPCSFRRSERHAGRYGAHRTICILSPSRRT